MQSDVTIYLTIKLNSNKKRLIFSLLILKWASIDTPKICPVELNKFVIFETRDNYVTNIQSLMFQSGAKLKGRYLRSCRYLAITFHLLLNLLL